MASSSGVIYSISYVGGDGNDVVLTVVANTSDFVVDVIDDENDGNFMPGDLSLREAIILANVAPDANTITFDASLVGQTIALDAQASGNRRLEIFQDVTITGPGADSLTIDGQDASQILFMRNAVVSISGLTLTNGNANGSDSIVVSGVDNITGGAIYTIGGELNLSDAVVSSSSSQSGGAGGGGIYATSGIVSITNSTS